MNFNSAQGSNALFAFSEICNNILIFKNRCLVLENFRIAKKSGIILLVYFKYF